VAGRAARNSGHRANRSDGVRNFTELNWLLAGALPGASRHCREKRLPRFGEEVIRFSDSDGLLLELIASSSLAPVEAWPDSPIPAEHALQGFHSVSPALEGYESTAKLLTDSFGYRLIEESGNRFRFASSDGTAPGRIVDLLCLPDTHMGRVAAGSVHHIAFRAKDDAEQLKWREHLVQPRLQRDASD